MNCSLQHKSLQKKSKNHCCGFRPEENQVWSWPPRRCSPAPVAAPAASAHSSDSKLTLDTARRFVSLDVPELDAEVVNSFVEVGADGATRFRCPCFVVRDSCGGRGSNKSSSVTLTRRRNLSKQPIIALVSTTARLGLAVAAGWAVRQRGACQRHISVDFFFSSFCSLGLTPCNLSQGLPVHKHKSAFDTAM